MLLYLLSTLWLLAARQEEAITAAVAALAVCLLRQAMNFWEARTPSQLAVVVLQFLLGTHQTAMLAVIQVLEQ